MAQYPLDPNNIICIDLRSEFLQPCKNKKDSIHEQILMKMQLNYFTHLY